MTDNEDELIRDHQDLVERIVDRRMRSLPAWIERDELVGSGMLALVQAAQRYDPSLDVPFGAFAQIRIDGAIRDSLRSADWLPNRVRAVQRRIELAEVDLRTTDQPVPDELLVASAVGISVNELRHALGQAAAAELTSLEDRIERRGDHDGAITSSHLDEQPEVAVLDTCMVARIRSMIEYLSDSQRVALVGSYLDDRTGVELAGQLGVSQSRVSQLRREALATLRVWLDSMPPWEHPADPAGA